MINVFIIDDSVLFRTKITKEIEVNKSIQVCGTANDASMAQKKLNILDKLPDIILLDVELPKVDGLTFFKEVLSKLNTKVIVCTSFYDKYRRDSLFLGIDKILDKNQIVKQSSSLLINEILKVNGEEKTKITIQDTKPAKLINNSKIVAIGASTGGLEVLEMIIPKLPENTPPILIVQHMGRDITPTFIPKIKALSNVDIKEAQDNEIIKRNTVYFAPFNKHLLIKKESINIYRVVLSDSQKVSYHKPSIDVLFNSFAQEARENVSAFILTGMGYDGVDGISNIKKNGGKTFAQDEQTSKVFGMPKAAIELNVIDKIIKPDDIIRNITSSY